MHYIVLHTLRQFQSITNFQYGAMDVRILMHPTITTLLHLLTLNCTEVHVTCDE